jgi:hypothetical protein
VATWNDLITRYTEGSRISPALPLNSIGIAVSSVISWDETVPDGTTLTIETALSFDGGQSFGEWQACSNGQPIPGIYKGTDLSNTYIKIRETLTTTDTKKTPELHSLELNIVSAYLGSGVLTSVVIDAALAQASYTVTVPENTDITVEYREGEGDNWGEWGAFESGQVIGSKEKIQYRVLFTSSDIGATPVLSEVKLSPISKNYAISPSVDISNAKDKNSGKIAYEATFNGTSAAEIRTRTSKNGSAWSGWVPIDAAGNIVSEHDNYIQILLILTGDNDKNNPVFDNLFLSYDETPSAEELGTGFTAGGQFYFATLLSKLIITNMLDAPKKWDGTSELQDLGGNPPRAQFVVTHKNYLFMARSSEGPSRLYFSSVLNIDEWPALNFIDISPNDGDWITGLLPYDDYLIITKNRSVWLLVGSGPSDFEVRRIHDGIGCVAPRSLVRVVDSFAFVSTEGIYLSDISTPTLISERLKETWKKMNRRRLHQIAGEFYDHKLRMDLPFGSSTVNNIRIIYDSIRKCLYLQEMSAHASCYAKYSEAGQEVLLFGHAGNGQVSHADTGTSDAGQPITMEWGTKHFNFGSSAIVKKARNLYFVTIPPSAPVEVQVYLIVDGEEMPTPLVFTVEPGKTVYKLKPRNIGVRNMRSLGYRIVVSETSGGVRFHELIQEYLMKKVKPS